MPIKIIAAGEVDGYIENSRCLLVDLRRKSDYQKIHIQGAVNIPYAIFEQSMYELPGTIPVILYCERGSASLDACKKATVIGINATAVMGGILAYRGKYLVKG